MEITHSGFDLLLYLVVYSFLGWVVEVCCIAIRDRHFVNYGFLNLPFSLHHGICAVVLLMELPPLDGNPILQYLLIVLVYVIVRNLTNQFIRSVTKKHADLHNQDKDVQGRRSLPLVLVIAGVYLLVYLMIHPIVFGVVNLLPEIVNRIIGIICAVLILIDMLSLQYALRTNKLTKNAEERKATTQRMGEKVSSAIWSRLQKAYPGIREADPQEQSRYVFAKGLCFDKLVWVFLVSSFLGALIEMAFCRITGGTWMSRSSVLYGAFSFVWGFGAVVLTVVLQRLANAPDRKVFLAGFFVGGAYEYFCSVFTEVVFGTVFWDYSEMPLNIGGRTNVLYCIFWGLLAVVWIKMIYPPMSRAIEKLPALMGKILTWVILLLMVCNGLLTALSMVRYTERQTQPEPSNVIEQFLDDRYDDAFMEKRWPNMIVTEE